MIGWVGGMCVEWGNAMRNRLFASGYPDHSALDGLLSGRSGFKQHFPEVMMSRDAKATDTAIKRMELVLPIEARVIWCEYVYRVSQRRGARVLGISHNAFRGALDTAHGYLAGQLDRPDEAMRA